MNATIKNNIRDFVRAVCKDLIAEEYSPILVEDSMIRNEAFLLKEMAVPKKEFESSVYHLMPMLLSHWALAILGREYGNINYEHWKQEIRTYIDSIRAIKLKGGDKLKVLRHLLIDKLEYNTKEPIKILISAKLEKEGITDDKWLELVSDEIINEVDDIIDSMANGGETPKMFVERIFPMKS